jgi:hypothetical protein
MRATPEQQITIDRVTYDMYVDCHCNASEAARQLSCDPTTVKERVHRHVHRERENQQNDR